MKKKSINKIGNYCKNCEAWCCYDGVYLKEDDERRIREVVENNKEFFSFLPKDYIVYGKWENLMEGKKTNTKPKKYNNSNYPKHFNQTTCVFCVDNKCMLQEFAISNGESGWKYKPKTCCSFPLQKKEGKYYEPNAVDDYCNIGEKYPGYVSFLPCYNLKKKDLNAEFEYTKKS